ncbi:MAG: hypothetical protein RSE00_03990, partial [Clostridia bacterium]
GDGIYETIEEGNYSYYGSDSASTPSNNWIKNKDDTESTSSNWDNDYSLLAHSSLPFFLRGGFFFNDSGAGVFNAYAYYGSVHPRLWVPSSLVWSLTLIDHFILSLKIK